LSGEAPFPVGGGEVGAAIRAHDWSGSRLGPPEAWPAALRIGVNLILNSSEAMYLAWGPDLLFFFNDAFRPLIRERAADALGRPTVELWPDWRDRLQPIVEKVWVGKPSNIDNLPISLARGRVAEETWWSFSYSPLHDETGAVAGMICIAVETTARVLAERGAAEALRQAEALLRHAQEAGGVGVFSIEVGDNLLRGTPEFSRIYGLPERDTLPAEAVERLVVEEDRGLVSNARSRLEGVAPLDVEYRIRRADTGEERWIARKAEYDRDEAGRPIRLVGVVQDVTERRAAQRAVEENAAKLAQLNATLAARVEEQVRERDRIWRNSRDLLVIVGADGVFRAINPAWKAILGHEPDEVVGRSFLDFIWPEDAAMTQDGLDVATRGVLTNFENRYTHLDGTPRWISWRTSHEGDLVYAYGRHIDAEKQQALALAEAEELLRHSQKMEAVGQLTGGIAHDFNNLLMAVMGNLDLLKRRLEQGRSDVDGLADNAVAAAKRGAALTRRLLAFSRRQPLAAERVEVDGLINGLGSMLRTTVGERISLTVAFASDLWPVSCDPHQLDNAVLNLVINARDAMPDGGVVIITAANCSLGADDERARAGCAPGDYVRISVRDTGEGMPPEVLAKAFEPFFTTKPIGQGTGLGLSMLYSFARQSGGGVWIDSAPGQGAEVTVVLPRAPPAPSSEAKHAPRHGVRGGGQTILLVEDEELIRGLMVEALTERGYVCLPAADGEEALTIGDGGTPIDLLISDIGLPGRLDGLELAARFRDRSPELKVIFTSGHAHLQAAREAVSGADMLAKPFDMEILLRRVAGALAVDAPLQP
jgi:PAS domain S-box-containing protein